MAPEQDVPTGAFYDHENETAPRRRRAAADWGVGEDIFDRMPSRRFKRGDRRAEHHEELEVRHFERRTSGPAPERRDEVEAFAPRRDDWADEHERRQIAPRRDDAPARAARRPAESWTAGDEQSVPVEGKRPIESWLEPEPQRELTLVPGESRTITLGTTEPEPTPEPPARRTVVISGHPDRLPIARTPRPPRTAVERIGASPDRIVGYAVLLGFVLVLIAVLTTNQ
jgi:hypothetical protein